MDFFQGFNIFLQIILILLLGGYIAGIFFLLNLGYKRKIKKREEFHRTLYVALKRNSIDSIDDIFNLYKGINNLNLPNDRYRSELNKLLLSFIVKLYGFFEEDNIKDEVIIKWKNNLAGYIKKNEEVSPFSNLPDAERNIMNDILTFLEVDNKTGVKTKTKELAGYIQSKSERIMDLERKNKVSTITAVIGLVLTVIFGILSLVLK